MHKPHHIAILAYDGVVPFDLTMALETFTRVRNCSGEPAYAIRVCTDGPAIDAGFFHLESHWRLEDAASADTVIVPGLQDPKRMPSTICHIVAEAARRGARIVSICSGSFVLAAAGILSGRRATTHWAGAADLSTNYPDVVVLPNVLYVEDGNIFTSGGATAGIDLCLHLIRCDQGSAAAAEAARLALVPLVRDGGQAQFVKPPTCSLHGSLGSLVEWAQGQRTGSLGIDSLARRAGVSTRTLTRRFQEQMGTSPQKFLTSLSIERAKVLLESTKAPVDLIAEQCGFNSTITFRAAFSRLVGIAPSRYRKAFRLC